MQKSNSKFVLPSMIALLLLCFACVCCIGVGLYFYGDQLLGISNSSGVPTTVVAQPSAIPATQLPADTSSLPEWTIMIYSAADDDVLEENMWFDVNEMELVGSNSQMNIVVQIDRYASGFSGDGAIQESGALQSATARSVSAIPAPMANFEGVSNQDNFNLFGAPRSS